MSALDRALRRVSQNFDPLEGLVAAVLGHEHRPEGPARRRAVAVATDRRLLLTSLRPAEPVTLTYEELAAVEVEERDGERDLLVHATDGTVHRVDRVTDTRALELFVELVEGHLGRGDSQRERPEPGRVRFVE